MLVEAKSNDGLGKVESWESAQRKFHSDLEDTLSQLRDTRTKIEQSQGEVNKLAKRNASITAHLQQIRGQMESTSKSDIQKAYNAALDAQQRLFVMRGQVEKLEREEAALEKQVELYESVIELMDARSESPPGSVKSFASVEMMIQAQEAERQRLSRQMHDGPAQALSNFILQTEIAGCSMWIKKRLARSCAS